MHVLASSTSEHSSSDEKLSSKVSPEFTKLALLEQHYPEQDVDAMIERLTEVGDTRRLMIKPYKLRFEGELMTKPKAGSYSLIYDSLKLWGVDPLPNVTHSSYIKTNGGKVIAVYLQDSVAERLSESNVGAQGTFYVLHAYNYEHGPRFLVLSHNEVKQTALTKSAEQ
jgi:hypothetical protein